MDCKPVPIGSACELEIIENFETNATDEEEDVMRLVQDFAAEQVGRMELTRPEVLRSVPAYVALDRCAEALRGGKNKDYWYRRSTMSDKVDAFWSHSWHGESWRKILTLLVLYNSTPALIAGMCTSVLMTLLFALNCLPGLQRVPGWDGQWCPWALTSGSLVSIVTFLLWRPRQRIFFDRVCIHQSDGELKTASILSLAGILKQSETMLVLWDSTYNERLWCLFELAAFLKSKDISPNVLIIKPIFIGPTAILIYLGLIFGLLPLILSPIDQFLILPASGIVVLLGAGQYLACASMRSYFRAIEEMRKSLRHLRVENTKCTCCRINHVDENGAPLICDRKVVQDCIGLWFGSQRGFEESIQTEVVQVLVRQLRNLALPYRWRVGISTPVFWACLDIVATFLKFGWTEQAGYWLILGCLFWLLVGPLILQWGAFLTCTFCEKQPGCRDVLRNFFVILLGLPAVVGTVGIFLVLQFAVEVPLHRTAVLLGGVLFSGCVLWCIHPQRLSCLVKVNPHPMDVTPG